VDFVLFILVTALLFIRPNDFVPGMEEAPFYLVAIVPCILLSWHKLVPQLTRAAMRERPVLVFAIGILLFSIVPCFLHSRFQLGLDFAAGSIKLIILFLLIQAHLDSPRRLKLFVGCVVGTIMIPILLIVLNYHGVIYVSAFKNVQDDNAGVLRLYGAGTFGDPNDICEIVNCAMIFSLYGLLDRGGGWTRVIWLAPLALFGHTLALTHSRGGFLGAVVGLVVLFRSRFRGTKSLVLTGATLALMFVVFGGRQTSFDTSEGTSQSRLQLWDAGFQLFTRAPLIGIGINQFNEHVGHVAHNAFINTYAELGFLGGTLLFGQFYYCVNNLAKLGSKRVTLPDPEMRRLRPFLLASLASFATSEMSLTNANGPMSCVLLGLATVYIRLADPSPPLPDLFLSKRLVGRIIILSGLFLAGLYVFTRLTVRY